MEAAARLYDAAAEELEQAAKHCPHRGSPLSRTGGPARLGARLGRARPYPRRGGVARGQARTHAAKSNP